MLCLHGEKCYSAPSRKNGGRYWYCRYSMFGHPSCHFKCYKDQADLYSKAVKQFLASKQDIPKCCAITSTEHSDGVVYPPVVIGRNYAKMKVVTDKMKENFGRPFFVCQHERDPCNYFEWGDQIIVDRPLCKHGKASRLLTVKKEGPNKDRKFFGCAEQKENRCDFFEWFEPEDPLLPNSDGYKKELLEKRLSSPLPVSSVDDETVGKKRKNLVPYE